MKRGRIVIKALPVPRMGDRMLVCDEEGRRLFPATVTFVSTKRTAIRLERNDGKLWMWACHWRHIRGRFETQEGWPVIRDTARARELGKMA